MKSSSNDRPKAPFRPKDIILWPVAIVAVTVIGTCDFIRKHIPRLHKVEIPGID